MFKKMNQLKTISGKMAPVKDLMPQGDVLEFFSKLTDAYTESQITSREIAAVQAQKEIIIQEIESKYELYHKVFDRLFDERKVAITKSFEIIDKGLASGDRELIGMGLQTLSQVVTTSPFADIAQLSKTLNKKDTIIEI